ncbi:hypothetical protein Tco_0836081 [Tanacetum coccineum]
MSTNGQTSLSQPTSVVRNALVKTMHQEKVQQEKLKAVKARLNFEETSLTLRVRNTHQKKGFEGKTRTKASHGDKEQVCLYTSCTQSVGRITVAIGTLKAAIKVPDQEQRSLPLRDVITKGHLREERRSC